MGMICFAEPGLTEEEFSETCICAIRTLDERPSIFIRDKCILSSERTLRKDDDSKGPVTGKNCGRESQGAWRQDELIADKPPVVN
jgi:hypothetical protein